jgi:hypothetical protein
VDLASKSDVLIALLTAEGLIFAALSIASAIAGAAALRAPTWGPGWLLSVIASVVLVLVAAAAIFAWADLFTGSGWSKSIDRHVEAIGLLLAIVAQPIIAVYISIGLVSD